MAEKNFALTPSVDISRSKFLRTNSHKTSFNLGDIVCLYCDEVLPADTRSIDFGALVRMSTPIAPILDDIELELFAFYCPNRILWKNWKRFMGESPKAGFDDEPPEAPYVLVSDGDITPHCIGDYMGLPAVGHSVKVSALPLRAYISIYNRWFRDQNVEAPIFIDDEDGEDASSLSYAASCLVAYKKSDYFTRALPYAQKGEPVKLPLGSTAPIIAGSQLTPLGAALQLGFSSNPTGGNTGLIVGNDSGSSSGRVFAETDPAVSYSTQSAYISRTNLLADLSQATAATINQLREAFQLQKLLERDALYGTRYWEILYGHFGTRAADASLQDPEYLGGARIKINVEQVLQTTGFAADDTSSLGTPGANSVTGGKGSLFTKSFTEHGWLMILAVARQSRHTYGQGISKMWTRLDRYDYYWPEFANLGAQEVKNKELFATGSSGANDEGIFGYQEYAAEYRYKPSIVSGLLNPNKSNSLDFWTLADNYESLPTLSKSFLQESRANLSRALVTGLEGPDFIADFYFQDIAVRPMPMFSIPGLIDHH